MTSGNVANISPNLMVNPKMSVGDKENSASFIDVMSKNVNNSANKSDVNSSQNNVSDKKINDTESSKVSKTTDENKADKAKVDKTDTKEQKDVKTKDNKVTDSQVKEEPVKENTSVNVVEEIPEEVIEVVNEVLNNFATEVTKVLEDALNISEDELQNAMTTLEVTFADLLNPKAVTELMVEVTDVKDSVSLVLNEDLSNALSTVRDLASQVLEETGLEAPVIKEVALENNNFNDVIQNVAKIAPEVTANVELDVTETEVVNDANKVIIPEGMVEVQDENVESDENVTPIIVNKESNVTKDVEVSTENVDESVEETFTKKEVNTNNSNNPNNSDNMARHDDGSKTFTSNVNAETQNIQNEQPVMQEAKLVINRFQTMQLISQISEQARINITKDVTSLEMILNPESLGKIYLNVSERQGAMKAQIVAQNEIVKEALENQVASLKESLNKAGVKVEAVEVSVGTHEFERNLEEGMHEKEEQSRQQEEQAANRAKRTSINLNNLDDLQGLMSEEDKLVAQMMKDHGNSINYMA